MSNKNRIFIVKYGSDESSMYKMEEIPADAYHIKARMSYYDADQGWTLLVRGKQAAFLHDDGDGVDITLNSMKMRFDYSMIEELRLMLEYYKDLRSEGEPVALLKMLEDDTNATN